MHKSTVVLVDAFVLVEYLVKVVAVRPERLIIAVLCRDQVSEAVEDEEAEGELATAAAHAHRGRGHGDRRTRA